MNNIIRPLAFCLLILGLTIGACKKDFTPGTEKKNSTTPTSTKDLVVGSNFSWTTNTETLVEITPEQAGLLIIQGEKAETYCKAYLPAGKLFTTRITFPTRVSKIYMFYRGNKEEIMLSAGGKHISKLK